jgi:hypothetical protein
LGGFHLVGGAVRIFKTRAFGRFARKERIGDPLLCDAIARADSGILDADLGGHVIKQRIARPGQGRSGGYRTLIAYRSETRAVFLFGFAKNDTDDIDDDALTALRKAAAEVLRLNNKDVAALVAAGKWTEVQCDD